MASSSSRGEMTRIAAREFSEILYDPGSSNAFAIA